MIIKDNYLKQIREIDGASFLITDLEDYISTPIKKVLLIREKSFSKSWIDKLFGFNNYMYQLKKNKKKNEIILIKTKGELTKKDKLKMTSWLKLISLVVDLNKKGVSLTNVLEKDKSFSYNIKKISILLK